MVFEDGTITSSTRNAVTYKHPTSGNVLRRITLAWLGPGLYAPNGQAGAHRSTACSLRMKATIALVACIVVCAAIIAATLLGG